MSRLPGQGSLFERLDPGAQHRRSRTRQEIAAERILAIKRQLAWILNARQGGSQSSPGLGLRDLNDATIGTVDLWRQVCEDVRTAIAAYEPRARVVDIKPLGDGVSPLELGFRLVCTVPLNSSDEKVEIDLVFHHKNRQVQVM